MYAHPPLEVRVRWGGALQHGTELKSSQQLKNQTWPSRDVMVLKKNHLSGLLRSTYNVTHCSCLHPQANGIAHGPAVVAPMDTQCNSGACVDAEENVISGQSDEARLICSFTQSTMSGGTALEVCALLQPKRARRCFTTESLAAPSLQCSTVYIRTPYVGPVTASNVACKTLTLMCCATRCDSPCNSTAARWRRMNQAKRVIRKLELHSDACMRFSRPCIPCRCGTSCFGMPRVHRES